MVNFELLFHLSCDLFVICNIQTTEVFDLIESEVSDDDVDKWIG